ncbi:MAG: NAD(P)H-hydrate dehydratase [Spirochaetia bacterium]
MRIVRPSEMAEIDRKTQEEFHIPGIVLMENAGIKGFFRWMEISKRKGEVSKLLFAAGGGNNGGDALVMARQAYTLLPESEVLVILAKRKLGELSRTHARALDSLGIPVAVWEEEPERALGFIEASDVIFDGIAGTGLKGALRSPLDSLVRAVNERKSFSEVVAIDVPSGIGEGFGPEMPSVSADITLTMGLPKTVLYTLNARPRCGRIERVAVGFPPELIEKPPVGSTASAHAAQGELIEGSRPLNVKDEAYKNTRGHTAVFSGAVGTTGAASLSASAASRGGAGLVTLHCDSELYPLFAGKTEGVMVKPFDTDAQWSPEGFSSIVAGPGWGPQRGELLRSLVLSGLPGVADADALRAAVEVAEDLTAEGGGEGLFGFWEERWVLTPHPGEFSLISDVPRDELSSDPIAAVAEAAARVKAVVLLKGHVCTIGAPDGRYAIVDGMNPAMGTGGSGDVLSGVIGGLLAGGMDPFEAACRGAAVHQEAGRLAAEKTGWFSAEELLPYISYLLWNGNTRV